MVLSVSFFPSVFVFSFFFLHLISPVNEMLMNGEIFMKLFCYGLITSPPVFFSL